MFCNPTWKKNEDNIYDCLVFPWDEEAILQQIDENLTNVTRAFILFCIVQRNVTQYSDPVARLPKVNIYFRPRVSLIQQKYPVFSLV